MSCHDSPIDERLIVPVVLQKIEAPVRDTIPDQGKPVEERNTNELAPGLKGSEALKPFDSDISADDAMR